MNRIKHVSKLFGLHPIVGAGMILADLLLFGGEASSLGLFWVISGTVGLLLAVPSVFVQKYVYGDEWTGAIVKSLSVGVLTAIPTPLPSLGTASLTAIGLIRWLRSPDGEHNESQT